MIRFDRDGFDLRRCSVYAMAVGLYDHETAGREISSWPQPVQVQMRRGFADWAKRYPAASVMCVTTAVEGRSCLLTIHHRAKG